MQCLYLFEVLIVAGVELLPVNTIVPVHPIKHPLQSLVVRSFPLSKTATYPASISIGRIYERPGANIADKDHTVKVPQKIILMDRSWGLVTTVYLCATREIRPALSFVLYLGNSR